jgi:hypothetical protein
VIAGAVLGVIVLLSILVSHGASHRPRAAAAADDSSSPVPDELVVNEKDLQNRVQVTPDYFRSRRPASVSSAAVSDQSPAPVAPDSDAPPTLSDLDDSSAAAAGGDLSAEDRRKRRENDPEDLIAHRHGGRSSSDVTLASATVRSSAPRSTDVDSSTAADATPPPARAVAPVDHHRPFLYYPAPSGATSSAAHAATSSASTLPAAGTVVPVVLSTPINLPLSGGTASVIAAVDADAPVPRGARFVGVASADEGGRLTVHFTRLLLPDNREAKLEAEAQDDTGAFGLQGVIQSNGAARARGVAGEVAAGAAADSADALVSTFTGGITGNLVRNATNRATQRGGGYDTSSPAARVTLAAGARFNVFVNEAAVERH